MMKFPCVQMDAGGTLSYLMRNTTIRNRMAAVELHSVSQKRKGGVSDEKRMMGL